MSIFEKNEYISNTASYGNDIASFAIRLGLQIYDIAQKVKLFDSMTDNHKTAFSILHQKPGIKLNITLIFFALDHFNQMVVNLEGGYRKFLH